MKKIFISLIFLTIVFSMTACSGEVNKESADTAPSSSGTLELPTIEPSDDIKPEAPTLKKLSVTSTGKIKVGGSRVFKVYNEKSEEIENYKIELLTNDTARLDGNTVFFLKPGNVEVKFSVEGYSPYIAGFLVPKDKEENENYIEDDQNEIIKEPINKLEFNSYYDFDDHLVNDDKLASYDSIYLLNAYKVLKYTNLNKYYLAYDEIVDNSYTNPRVIESFYYYDKQVGTYDKTSDGYDYSFKIDAIFYFNSIIDGNISFSTSKISATKAKVIIKLGDNVIGIAFVEGIISNINNRLATSITSIKLKGE